MKAAREEASSPRLRVVAPARRVRGERSLGVVGQVRLALRPQNRLATFLGGMLGGAVPVASWQLSRAEVDPSQPLWGQVPAWLVAAGLLFSATTVYGWGRQAFGSGVKAAGFCALLEGVLVASRSSWLAAAALAYLIAVNAVATGTRLSRGV